MHCGRWDGSGAANLCFGGLINAIIGSHGSGPSLFCLGGGREKQGSERTVPQGVSAHLGVWIM